MTCLVTRRRERGVADADESVVGEDLDDQPAVERERAHRGLREHGASRSIGFVQKCGGSGTVLPCHCDDAGADLGDFHWRPRSGQVFIKRLAT